MTRNSDFSFNSIDLNKKASIVDKHDFILGTYTGDWTRNTPPWNKLYKKSYLITLGSRKEKDMKMLIQYIKFCITQKRLLI